MAPDGKEDPLKPVTVSLKDLEAGTIPLSTLTRAFGPHSLGILLVTDLPPSYSTLRSRLLSYSSYLANLPPSTLHTLTRPDAKHLVGWSHGVEALSPGHYDTRKGSYYINCAFHVSPELHAAPATSPRGGAYPDFPEYTAANVWPGEGALPGFRASAEALCGLVIGAAALVARACDRFGVAEVEGYRPGTLEGIVRESLTTKARLLHYFPCDQGGDGKSNGAARNGRDGGAGEDEDDDDWCATHVDHGCLTGLTSAMYIDETQHAPIIPATPNNNNNNNDSASTDNKALPPLPELPTPPDPKTGLYIRSRQGTTTKVSIPRDSLAFQTGEALERITKGRFRAVPHFVRGASGDKARGVARNTLAVFTQPNLWEVVDEEKGLDMAAFARGVVEKHT